MIAALANPPQRNVVVLGAPGADTTALSQQLCSQYRLLHVNTTELLRKADFGGDGAKVKQVADALASGSAVPDALVAEVLCFLFLCVCMLVPLICGWSSMSQTRVLSPPLFAHSCSSHDAPPHVNGITHAWYVRPRPNHR